MGKTFAVYVHVKNFGELERKGRKKREKEILEHYPFTDRNWAAR
jgi:hypothetical protein